MTGPTVFKITIDLSELIPPSSPLNRTAFPNLAHAVEMIAATAHERWSTYARGQPLPSGKVIQNRTGEYLRSIEIKSRGDFSWEVFSMLPYAVQIEQGSPARDMKLMLNSSLKVRTAKDGSRYLIIPFRHNNPKSVLGHRMPVEVWRWWQHEDRTSSHVTGTYRRISGTGAFDIKTRQAITVPGWRYKWGTKLGEGDLAKLGITGTEAKSLAGMYNFRNPGASGGARQSRYVNFRVMSSKSPAGSWVAPARDGLYAARTVADEIRPAAERIFAEAASEDIKQLLAGK